MCRLRNIALGCDRRTDGQTDGWTDRRRTKWSLCVAMLRRRHKNYMVITLLILKTRGMNPLVWTEPWQGLDGRFIPRVFPILISSTWLFNFLPKLHFNQLFFVLRSIWPIFRVSKSRLTSLSDVITTCVRMQELATGKHDEFDMQYWITNTAGDKLK